MVTDGTGQGVPEEAHGGQDARMVGRGGRHECAQRTPVGSIRGCIRRNGPSHTRGARDRTPSPEYLTRRWYRHNGVVPLSMADRRWVLEATTILAETVPPAQIATDPSLVLDSHARRPAIARNSSAVDGTTVWKQWRGNTAQSGSRTELEAGPAQRQIDRSATMQYLAPFSQGHQFASANEPITSKISLIWRRADAFRPTEVLEKYCFSEQKELDLLASSI
jgi:hypothetical protein